MRTIRRAGEFGLHTGELSIDFPTIIARKDEIVRKSVENDAFRRTLEDHGIPMLQASATILSPHELQVNGDVIRADRVIIAAGSAPAVPPIPGLRESGYITSDEALHLRDLPGSVIAASSSSAQG